MMIRFFYCLLLLVVAQFSYAVEPIWLLVDTTKSQLLVKQGEDTLKTFEDIAVGLNGAAIKQQRGDEITPLGTYKISRLSDSSKFYRFYELDYPSAKDGRRALREKRIDLKTFQEILHAHQQNRIPPQNTPLGGHIGIHGLGRGDVEIHQISNWTKGCIALTNAQIDSLAQWIKQGMRVEVR